MRELHNVFLCLILGAFSAIPASASSFTNFVGWGKGDENLEAAFYPVIDASPRYLTDTNWHFAKDVWANDFLLAVWERAVYGDDEPAASLSDLYDFFGWGGVRVPFESERLHELKQVLKSIVPNYVNLTVRTNGTYDAWFEQWDYEASPYNGTNYVDYLSDVINPPNWTFGMPQTIVEGGETNIIFVDVVTTNGPVVVVNSKTAFFEYSQIPTNFFDYTPARFLGATEIGFVNTNTLAGGDLPEGRTNDWNTLDYGWDGLMRALSALQDVGLTEDTLIFRESIGEDFSDESCPFLFIGPNDPMDLWDSLFDQYGCVDIGAADSPEVNLVAFSAEDKFNSFVQVIASPLAMFGLFEITSEFYEPSPSVPNSDPIEWQISNREPSFIWYGASHAQIIISGTFPTCSSTNIFINTWQGIASAKPTDLIQSSIFDGSFFNQWHMDLFFTANLVSAGVGECCADWIGDIEPAVVIVQDCPQWEEGQFDDIDFGRFSNINARSINQRPTWMVFRPDFVYDFLL